MSIDDSSIASSNESQSGVHEYTSKQYLIFHELYLAIRSLEGNAEILSIVSSLGDTLSDDDALELLRSYNSKNLLLDL